MRLKNWRSNLNKYLKVTRNKKFKYGDNDCALFAAGAVDAITGSSYAAEFRGKYRTMAGGLRAVKRTGYTSHLNVLERNFDEIPVPQASSGDIAVLNTDEGPCLGVVSGSVAHFIGRHPKAGTSMIVMPFDMCSRAFRV